MLNAGLQTRLIPLLILWGERELVRTGSGISREVRDMFKACRMTS